ncbi:MAG TPA: hypothetical protein PLE61_08790 [Vicinamibacterales bacterium]|nr:hypothetical protein [Vicinamibacterales bacterium]HPW20899.1 hypothetical protein [Vicinamibacterales bacterium]
MTLSCWSPIRRFTHKLTALISSVFAPAFSAGVTSTRNGVFQAAPTGLSVTLASAVFFASPRSSQSLAPEANQSAGASTVFVQLAVPEKYFAPASACSVQEMSAGSAVFSGAPRLGWNATSQASCR